MTKPNKTFKSDLAIIQFVREKLLKQGIKSEVTTDEGYTACRYRAAGGLKCAVGHLIPDELYDVNMEGKTIDGDWLWPKLRGLFPNRTNQTRDMLTELQEIHDGHDVSEWEAEFNQLEKKYA